uniref:Uncharacterized protein n=1 Tax=Falco tinnunculus TaxID=100819 RepID=A0A8C4VAL3_FALTI
MRRIKLKHFVKKYLILLLPTSHLLVPVAAPITWIGKSNTSLSTSLCLSQAYRSGLPPSSVIASLGRTILV